MQLSRIFRHLLASEAKVRRAFPRRTLNAIEAAIKAGEARHFGEIRFAVEGALDGAPLWRDQSAQQRALELFAHLRVWDTEHNNGLLIYLLLADHAVEIVADRGIHARVGAPAWKAICQQMEQAFRRDEFEAGVVSGVQAVAGHLAKHFPSDGPRPNELPDSPVVL